MALRDRRREQRIVVEDLPRQEPRAADVEVVVVPVEQLAVPGHVTRLLAAEVMGGVQHVCPWHPLDGRQKLRVIARALTLELPRVSRAVGRQEERLSILAFEWVEREEGYVIRDEDGLSGPAQSLEGREELATVYPAGIPVRVHDDRLDAATRGN